MSYGFLDVAVTPGVRAAQASMGSDNLWIDFAGHREFDQFTGNEAAFIAERDSFYISTVSETGWPYVQHRGGPRGFVKVVDTKTLAFADYGGNRQYISLGNLKADDRACLIMLDYAKRARLKIYAHVEVVGLDDDPRLTELVSIPGYKAKLERIFVLRLKTFDWNCPQHITRRYTMEEIDEAVAPLRERIRLLETQNSELQARLSPEQAETLALEEGRKAA